MKTIQTKHGVNMSYDDIIAKQERYARRKQKKDRLTYSYGVIRALPHMNTQIVTDDPVMAEYNHIARKAINRIKNMVTADMSLHEVEKLVRDESRKFVKHAVLEIDGAFLTPMEYAGVLYNEKQDEAKRIKNWIETNKTKARHDEFYFVIKIPQFNVMFDSRKKLFRYDHQKKVPVRDPNMAIYSNTGQTRYSAQLKLMMAISKQHNMSLDTPQALASFLKSEGYTLESSFRMVPCIHNKKIDKFPALFFTLARSMNNNSSFNYASSGSNERFDENIVQREGNHEAAPLTHYELEDAIIKGLLDDDLNIYKESIEDAYVNDSRGARNREFADLPIGIDAYASLAMSLDRMDLVELATDYKCPVCPMTEDIAEAVWNGEMLPPDAIILWGDKYKHKNVVRKGLWLRKAMDILVNNRYFDFDDPDNIDQAYYERVDWLRQKYGRDRLNQITSDFHNERTIYIHGQAYVINKATDKKDLQAVIDHLGLQAFRAYS